MDLVANTSSFPTVGETVTGEKFAMIPGGKGANQAIAVSRLGYPCHLVGRVGKDSFGEILFNSLQDNGVETTGVFVDESAHTGVAMITVNETGENHCHPRSQRKLRPDRHRTIAPPFGRGGVFIAAIGSSP